MSKSSDARVNDEKRTSLDQAVNPAKSAKITLADGNKSAMGSVESGEPVTEFKNAEFCLVCFLSPSS